VSCTSSGRTAAAYWAYDAKLMSEMTHALSRRERTEHYERLRTGTVAAFNRAHVGDDACIEGDTQTVYLLALHMDLLPARLRARAAERLVADIEATTATSPQASSASACCAPC
jgi:alpha-L-rhamnosidase